MGCSANVEGAGFSTIPCHYCEIAKSEGEDSCWPNCNGTREVPDHREVSCSYSTLMRILRQLGSAWNSQYDDIAEEASCSFPVESLAGLEADLVRVTNRLSGFPATHIPEGYAGFLTRDQGNRAFMEGFLEVVQYAIIHKKPVYWA
jgi:hypothetical protein